MPDLVSLTQLSIQIDIGQNSVGDVSNFQISVQSLREEYCHNSRTSTDVDMKLRHET